MCWSWTWRTAAEALRTDPGSAFLRKYFKCLIVFEVAADFPCAISWLACILRAAVKWWLLMRK